jgi:hypothetical protein
MAASLVVVVLVVVVEVEVEVEVRECPSKILSLDTFEDSSLIILLETVNILVLYTLDLNYT